MNRFAREAEQAMLTLITPTTVHSAPWESREYRMKNSQKRNTRSMIREDAER